MTQHQFRTHVDSLSHAELIESLGFNKLMRRQIWQQSRNCSDMKLNIALTRQFHQIDKQILILTQMIHNLLQPDSPLTAASKPSKLPAKPIPNSLPSSEASITANHESKISAPETVITDQKPAKEDPKPEKESETAAEAPPIPSLNEIQHNGLNRKERRALAAQLKEQAEANNCSV